MSPVKKGILYEVFTYVFWGLMPLYWRLLVFASPLRILGGRITFALFFAVLVLFLRGNRKWLLLFTVPEKRLFVILAGLTVTINWGLYIWAVNNGHTIEASVGYYINPLISILLALVFLREHLSVLQWAAFGFAALGVFLVTLFSGVFPWISLGLAITFGVYGFFKKKNKTETLESLAAETLIVLPLGLVLFVFPSEDLLSFSPRQYALLVSTGIITALPLYTFAKGAKLIPLSTLGFLQFISPTILFILGVFVFGENFSPKMLVAYGFIWTAVVLYCFSLNNKQNDKPENHESS